jgi:hypothetical protein
VSDTAGPVPDPTSATEPLQLADQQPVEAAPVAVQPRTSHTRTILEVVGAAVAAILILTAGGLGFALGHVTAGHDRGRDGSHAFSQGAPGGSGQGGGMMGGQGQQGFGRQGFGQPGQQGQQGQGMDPRGIDPDGDNWSGGGMMGGQGQQGFGLPGFGQQGQGTAPGTSLAPTPPAGQ